jgi:hypoxanthine phosphoribosyltransferase
MNTVRVHDKTFIPYISEEAIRVKVKDLAVSLRHVVILEDIVDTGKTLHEFLPQLMHQQPASLKIVALLHKPAAKVYPLQVDYTGFELPDKFVVGYGLDYNGLGRNTAAIYQLFE